VSQHRDRRRGQSHFAASGGLANGFGLSTLNGALTGNTVINRVSSWDPGIGLGYQF
jgi:hypothetical protein